MNKEEINKIMENITSDESLCLIREALEGTNMNKIMVTDSENQKRGYDLKGLIEMLNFQFEFMEFEVLK